MISQEMLDLSLRMEVAPSFLELISNNFGFKGGIIFNKELDFRVDDINPEDFDFTWNTVESEEYPGVLPDKQSCIDAYVIERQKWINAEYARKRKYNYPSLEDQLDALYWDIKNGNINFQSFTDMIDEVKSAFPKQ